MTERRNSFPELNPTPEQKAAREAQKQAERAAWERRDGTSRRELLYRRKYGTKVAIDGMGRPPQPQDPPAAEPTAPQPPMPPALLEALAAEAAAVARGEALAPKSEFPVTPGPVESDDAADGFEGDQLEGAVDAEDRAAVAAVAQPASAAKSK
jgi:hypothetical protein